MSWKSREADKLWEEALKCERQGGGFKSKTKEMDKIKYHLDKVGGVKQDEDRGEMNLSRRIDKKFNTDEGKDILERMSKSI